MARGAPGARTEAEWLDSILESAFDGVFVLEAIRGDDGRVEDLRYVLSNPGAERLVGREAEQLLGRGVTQVFPGLRATGFHGDLLRVLETGERLETQFSYEGEGVRGWFRASGVRIGGEHVALTVRDVSDDVHKEQALQQSEQHLRFITSTSRDILSFHDADGRVSWISDACREVTGYEPDELVGRRPGPAIHPDDRPGVHRAYRHLVEDGREETITSRLVHKDGHYVWVQSLGRAVTDPMGAVTGFMLSTREVSEQMESHHGLERALKDLQRANEALTAEKQRSEAAAQAKSRFLATMSHEIRTPLNGIIGVLSLLERESFPERIAELMDTLHASSSALLSVVNDVLDFSKIEAEQLVVERRPFDPKALLDDVVAAFRPTAESKGLAFRLEKSGRIPDRLSSDRVRLRQVLFNLVSNAIKFTARGQITLRADFEPEHRMLILEVADTGIGIPKSSLQTIFQPFSQADASTTRRFGGTGLGLAIVNSLTQLLGGTLTVDSHEHRGTRFRVALPVESFEPTGDFDEDSVSHSLSGALETDSLALRVLLVEDNAVNRKVAATMIRRLGHQVESAVDGLEAVERLERETFDLVLMDLQMPRLDGLEATRRIRARHGGDMPVVALTANAFDEDRQACLDAGMDGHLTKPLRLDDLERALRTIAGA